MQVVGSAFIVKRSETGELISSVEIIHLPLLETFPRSILMARRIVEFAYKLLSGRDKE